MNVPYRPLLAGVIVGLVTSLDDPEALARVQVRYPTPGEQVASCWARLVTPMAGADRGILFRPEVGDEVLLTFEHGLAERPYVIGALWSRTDRPPAMGDPAVDNNWRVIRSRSGHVLTFDDTAEAERIQLIDKDRARSLLISCADKRIVLDNSDEGGAISFTCANGTITVRAGEKITVNCTEGDVDVTASAGTVKVTALNVNVTAEETMSLKATAELNVESEGPVNIKGLVVNIN